MCVCVRACVRACVCVCVCVFLYTSVAVGSCFCDAILQMHVSDQSCMWETYLMIARHKT